MLWFFFIVLDLIWQTHITAFAAWLQPLQTETSPLLPWIQADCEAGKKMVEAFVFVTQFLHQAFLSKKEWISNDGE